MGISPDHRQYLEEGFARLLEKWGAAKERYFSENQYRRASLELIHGLSGWSADVVRAFQRTRFPSYTLRPYVATGNEKSLVQELTGTDNEAQAGLRIIYWTALYAAPELLDDDASIADSYKDQVRNWAHGLFANSDKELYPAAEPISWVTQAFKHLLDDSPLIECDVEKKKWFIKGKEARTSPAEFAVVKALYDKAPDGLTKDELDEATGSAGSVVLLKKIQKRDVWKDMIILPGQRSRGGYRLRVR